MKNDTTKIILTFLATVLLVYGIPRLGIPLFINQVLFLLLIGYIYTSKDDVFWLVWFFIMVDAPGRIFSSGYASNAYRLPLYSVAPGVSLDFTELFIFMYIFKAIRYKTPTGFLFKKQIWLFILIAVFYFLISFMIGISFQNIILTIRTILPWIWVLIIPRYISTKDDLRRAYLLLVPAVVISFIALLQTYITGVYLGAILSGMLGNSYIVASEQSLARIYSAAYLTFFCTVMSLYYLSLRKSSINSNLLIFISFLGTVSVFLSATRGWVIALIVLYSSFFFISGFSMFKQLARVLVIIGLTFVILTSIFPLITSQGSLAFQRLLTLENLIEGDLTAGGTLSRLTDRSPRVMAIFRESPVFGWAFSNKFHAYADGHVANQTNLLNFGILGFIAINLIYLSICFRIYQRGRRYDYKQRDGNSYGVFLYAMFALFVAHSSSGMLWGFMDSSPTVRMMWAFLFAAISVELSPGGRSMFKPV